MAAGNLDPVVRARRRLAERLRRLRLNAGLTAAQLADRLGHGWSQPKISRIENAAQGIAPANVRAWAELLLEDAAEVDDLVDEAWSVTATMRSYRVSLAEGHASVQASYGELEQAAKRLRMFQHYVVPGLLQTRAYAAALFRIAHPAGGSDPDGAADARLARQAILDDDARRFEWVLTEAALHWRPGTWGDLSDQLHAVQAAGLRPNVEIRMIPLGAPATTFYHSFTLFDDALVFVETVIGEGRTNDPDDVAHVAEMFERLRESALDVEATQDRLEALTAEFAARRFS